MNDNSLLNKYFSMKARIQDKTIKMGGSLHLFFIVYIILYMQAYFRDSLSLMVELLNFLTEHLA